jgi:hypothetical protein
LERARLEHTEVGLFNFLGNRGGERFPAQRLPAGVIAPAFRNGLLARVAAGFSN